MKLLVTQKEYSMLQDLAVTQNRPDMNEEKVVRAWMRMIKDNPVELVVQHEDRIQAFVSSKTQNQ